jgi:hypothetical protein
MAASSDNLTSEQKALKAFVDTVEETGRLIQFEDGSHACCGDEEWIDLGEAALLAKKALVDAGIEPTLRVQDAHGIPVTAS